MIDRDRYTILPNTAGCYTAEDALRTARLARELGLGDLVKLEDPEFEKEFVVYGSDQIEARYILSPGLMERIVEFKRKAKRKIHLSFVQSWVNLAIEFDKDLFEAPLFGSALDYPKIRDYFRDLQLAFGIVEDLNLNTRIWTKT